MNYIENLKAAIAFIEALPDAAVDLSDWRGTSEVSVEHPCGSVACLGGWIAVAPHFRKLGVYPSRSVDEWYGGAPCIEIGGRETLEGSEVSVHLFGTNRMFTSRMHFEFGTDREVALYRLRLRLAELEDAS